jgi:hypothetical protein
MTTITTTRPLYEIAKDIIVDINNQYVNKGKLNPSWVIYATPYIVAMSRLESIDEDYFADTAHSVVCYALSNLSYWRGDVAKSVKLELKALIK